MVQIDDLENLLEEVAKITALLKKTNIAEYTKKASKYMQNQSGYSNIENVLKGMGAVIIIIILMLIMSILKKINESVKSHVF
jgi:hypothetical protein